MTNEVPIPWEADEKPAVAKEARATRRTDWELFLVLFLVLLGTVFSVIGFAGGVHLLYLALFVYPIDVASNPGALLYPMGMNLLGTAGVLLLGAAVAAWRRKWRHYLITFGLAVLIIGGIAATTPTHDTSSRAAASSSSGTGPVPQEGDLRSER